ncbi:MAG: hypothetical protein PARBA_00744 [Parabacteroides sp.]
MKATKNKPLKNKILSLSTHWIGLSLSSLKLHFALFKLLELYLQYYSSFFYKNTEQFTIL